VSVEVPCTRCGNAAVELTPPTLTAAVRLVAGKVARMFGAGGELDPEAPIIGMTAEQFAQAFGVKCIACVDSVTASSVNGEKPDSSSASSPPDCDSATIVDATYDAATH
jgi:hypothetical protein